MPDLRVVDVWFSGPHFILFSTGERFSREGEAREARGQFHNYISMIYTVCTTFMKSTLRAESKNLSLENKKRVSKVILFLNPIFGENKLSIPLTF